MATSKKKTNKTKMPAKKSKPLPAKKPPAKAQKSAPVVAKKATTSAGKQVAAQAKAPFKAGPGKSPTKPGTMAAPPASRVPARTPERAEELKAKIGALASATNQIRALKRSLNKSFYEIGTILGDVQNKRLYEAKGYGSFEAFVEREIDLGKQLSLRVVRITQTFLKDAALSAGLDRVSAALAALEGDSEAQSNSPSSPPPAMPIGRSALPPHKH